MENEEEDVFLSKEPKITSEDPEERKRARALRIKKRQDALRKAEQTVEEQVTDEEPGLVEQAMMQAAVELQQLALDGTAKVTNVKVTCDEREVLRRKVCAEKKQATLDLLASQAEEAQLQYEAVTQNWDAMMKIREPLEIQEAMQQQMIACDSLLKQKDKVIKQLKDDLKEMDMSYNEDLEKQDKDIKELGDRIEKQIAVMQKAYEKQLGLIETAIGIERDTLLEMNNKRWEMLYKIREKEEVQHIEQKVEQLEEQKQVMEQIMWENHEKYREAKMELETLIQDLQKELEKLKATCLINTEKIGYNYQILKKREEENVFVRSQQKRKLNKMSDVSNALRAKIRKAAQDGAIEEVKADEEIVRLMEAMSDLEKKSNQFSKVNDYKFCQVWRMSMARCRELGKQLRAAEVAVHAHILAEPPPPPPPPPPKNPLIKLSHDLEEKKAKEDTAIGKVAINEDLKNEHCRDSKERLVQHILQLVADNTGFLIEDRLLKLIEKNSLSSRNLCTLDAIFMALEIQDEADIDLLCQTFMNYAFCPICDGGIDDADSSDVLGQGPDQVDVSSIATTGFKQRSSVRTRTIRSTSGSTARSVIIRAHDLSPDDQALLSEADQILQKCGDPQAPPPLIEATPEPARDVVAAARRQRVHVGTDSTAHAHAHIAETAINPFTCHNGHLLEIEPMQVLTALGDFISVFVPPDKKKLYDVLNSLKPPDFTTVSRILKPEEIEQYWNQWENMFPQEKQKLWDGLLSGLNKYLVILQERERLHDEVSELRRQNAQLRGLMRNTLPRLPQLVFDENGQFTVASAGDGVAKLPPI